MNSEYISTKTGYRLERKPGMFYFRGQCFSGLVDVQENCLYDDPQDSFAARTGTPSSLSLGLIIEYHDVEMTSNVKVQPPAAFGGSAGTES